MPEKILELEQLALAAHQAGTPWSVFWARVAHEVKSLAPYDRAKFREVYNRLLHLLTTGDRSGEHPAGDDNPSPFERDDQPKPSDTETQARLQVAEIQRQIESSGGRIHLGADLTRPDVSRTNTRPARTPDAIR